MHLNVSPRVGLKGLREAAISIWQARMQPKYHFTTFAIRCSGLAASLAALNIEELKVNKMITKLLIGYSYNKKQGLPQ